MRQEIEEAIALLKQGQGQALEQALELLQNTVFSFSMKVCGQREDAEDTMQEVLLKSLPYLPRFDSPKALVVWLYKVAKNRCLMSRRKSKFAPKENLSLEDLMPGRQELEKLAGNHDVTPETSAMRSEATRHLREAVQKLPPPYRIVLVLHDMEGLSDEEVGEITGLRPGTVRVRLHRARLFVRKELSKQEMQRARRRIEVQRGQVELPRPRRCKQLFAELSDYLDDELDDSLCEELERHMDGCEPCQAFLASLEHTIRRCREAPGTCPDRRRATKLRKELLAQFEQAVGKRD